MRRPNQQDLNAINLVSPSPMDESSCYVLEVIAADNLISRSRTRWDKDGLEKLKKMAQGIPVLMDHEWEIDETIGLVFGAKIEFGGTPSLTDYGSKKINDEILASEGWIKLVLSLALTCEDAEEYYKAGKLRAVSLGGFNWEYYECGECKVDIRHPKCNHLVPCGYDFYSDPTMPEAPYVVRRNPFDLGEISFVVVPNLPNARVVMLGTKAE